MKKLFYFIVLAFICVTFGSNVASAAKKTDSNLPYIIKEGTRYYETAESFGSGRSGIVNKKNIYTTTPCYAGINGYAYLDKNGDILDSNYIESENDIFIPEAPKGAVKLFKHFKSVFYRNGWVNGRNVIINEIRNKTKPKPIPNQEEKEIPTEQEQKPEDIIKQIDNIQKKNQKTTIVIDYSGSMDDNQREVVELLETLEFSDNTKIIVFGSEYDVITKKQLDSNDFYVGGETHMIAALNEAVSLETENLIIISDLDTYDDVTLVKSEKLKSVVIYDPDDGFEDLIVDECLKVIWDKATISRVKIK